MLTEQQLKGFEDTLLKEKKTVEGELKKIAKKDEDGKWVTKYEDIERDDETNANEVEEFTNREAVVNTLSKNLKKIENALQRIKDGTYGKCVICGGYIRPERLRAFPEADTCTKCATK